MDRPVALPLARLRSALGLERNVVAMLAAVLALGMGEEEIRVA